MQSFRGQTVLITGGTSGIGLAMAQAFTSAGAYVLSPDPRELDVTSAKQVETFCGGLQELHALINCAGIIQRDAEFEMPVFEHVLDVNLNGTMRMCVGCKPQLAKSRGSIVNIASVLTFLGGARVPAYSASKGAIAQLTRSLAVAWAGDGIRVNAVAPGWIRTALTQGIQDDAQRASAILSRTPMARWGEPDEIAGPALFLCSDAARFITGAILPVDGGYTVA